MEGPTPEQLMRLPQEYLAQNSSKKLLDTSIAMIVVTTFFFSLFVTSRVLHHTKDSWDVWILPPFSFLCVIGLAIIGILMVKIGGGGRHIEYHLIHDPTIIMTYLQLQTAAEFFYVIAASVPKLTLLFLYLKLFGSVGKTLPRLTWALIVFVLLQWLIVGVIVWATICQPLRYKWDKSISGHCGDLLAAYRYFSVPNLISDIGILLLPLHTIWNLHVSSMRKAGIFFTLFSGGAGIVAALVRFVGFFNVPLMQDPTYYAMRTMVFTIVEPAAYFICSTTPYIRPLMNWIYHESGLATTVSQTIMRTKSSSNSASTRRRFPPSGNDASNYSATISASVPSGMDASKAGFIELRDTVDVTSSRA